MIQFLQLEITNFLSWGQKQIVPLNKQGVILIEGVNLDEPSANSNMAGKSSLMEAILWCLYARTIRGLKHDSVVNRFSKTNCCVQLLFRTDNYDYRVCRYRLHELHRNRLFLWRGRHPLTYRHEKETQNKLESILGCDYESFVHTTIFGGPRPFALLTDAEQKKILESFLHFEKFEIALRRTKQLLSKTLVKEHDHELRTVKLRADIQGIRDRLGSLSRADRVGKEESKREREKIERRLQELSTHRKRLREHELEKIKREFEEAGEKVEALVTKVAKASEKSETIHQHLKALYRSLRDGKGLIGKSCPTCGHYVTAKNVDQYLSHTRRHVRATKNKLRKIVVCLSKYERRLTYARKDLKRVQLKLRTHEEDYIKYESSRRELQKRLDEGKGATPFAEEIQLLSKIYSRKVSKLLSYEKEAKVLKRRIEDLKFWEEGFGNHGVKALIVREALPAMNRKLKEYAQEIFHGTARLKFSPAKKDKKGNERELFNLQYRSRYGTSSYLGESSGGRKRVDICVLLVFSWLSTMCNLLLVDELLDGLDDTGRETVLDILSRLRGTILVISHKKELKSRIGRVWTVIKKHGASRLEMAA